MKRKIAFALCISLTLMGSLAKAQTNLVPNPSFESYVTCPGIELIGTSPVDFKLVTDWFNPSGYDSVPTSPDYFNACSLSPSYSVPSNFQGYQKARKGYGYAGLAVGQYPGNRETYREYIACRLKAPMIKDSGYFISMNVSLADGAGAHTNSLGIYLANTYEHFSTTANIQKVPQILNKSINFLKDSSGWVKIAGYYRAKGGEEWLIIGNFNNNLNTVLKPYPNFPGVPVAYYYIDDVYMIQFFAPNTIMDTTICLGGSVSCSMRDGFYYCEWNDGNTEEIRTFSSPGKYWVTSYMNDTLSYTDTFNIAVGTPTYNTTYAGFCYGKELTLKADQGTAYLWNTLAFTHTITISQPGMYWAATTKENGCLKLDTFFITRWLPDLSALKDTLVCFDEVKKILLNAGGKFKDYLWKPTGEVTQTIYSTTAQLYMLTVTDSNDCFANKTIAVDESCPMGLYVPNAFTPNKDGTNDVLTIKGIRVVDFSMDIQDRWGRQVFHTTNLNQYWDGADLPDGVYFILITYRFKDDVEQAYRSTVTLMR
jgi:gliding motility-associated-like protein